MNKLLKSTREQAGPRLGCSGAVASAVIVMGFLSGCVVNRPVVSETITGTNGVVTTRTLKVTSFAVWPASQNIEKQRVSLGRTFSLGQTGFEQEGGGTNVVEALKSIDSILGKIK